MSSSSASRRTSTMAERLVSEVPQKKRKTEARPPNQKSHCMLAPVRLLSSTELLLQMPPNTNASLPVWESVSAARAEVMWSVTPYRIIVQIAPLTSQNDEQPAARPSSLPETQLSALPAPASLPAPSGQSLPRTMRGASLNQNTPNPPLYQTPTLATPRPRAAAQTPRKALPRAPGPPRLGPSSPGLAGPDAGAAGAVVDLPSVFRHRDAGSCYTRRSAGVYICDRFLAGRCRSKLNCGRHHTPFPFHWQLKYRETQQWLSVSLSAQVNLEKMYCNTDQETAKLQDENDIFFLLLDTMTVRNSVKYDEARRLSNSSNAARLPCMSTLWKIYWWNDYAWECYKKDVSMLLLGKIEAGKGSCRFHIGEQEYEVDFSTMTQRNLTTGFQRRVRRRPMFRPLFTLKSQLKTVDLEQPPQNFRLPNLSVDPLEEFSSWYPPVWTLGPDQDSDQGYSLVEVPPSATAYQSIYRLFHSTISETKIEIISIQQVQNIFQWDRYRRQKEHMQSRSPAQSRSQERHLFHGTTEDSSKEICLNNFDPRVSGKNGTAYGQGSYFARNASYSDTYTLESGEEKCQHMFLAKVLVGRMSVGKTRFRRPPRLNSQKTGHERYDTCVNRLYNPTTFVVFDSCQCYPYYLIKYREVSRIVNIA